MPELPEYKRPPEAVRDHILMFYHEHSHEYARVWPKLEEIRQRWRNVRNGNRIALLKLSYLNSVISVNTPVDQHEATFKHIIGGDTLEEAFDKGGAGLGGMKIPSIRKTLADDELWDDVNRHLKSGNVDAAHHRLLEAGWLGAAKAPFTLCNLGFVQKMCIDANVARLMRADAPDSRTGVQEYEGLCADIQDMFPRLSEILDPYELQWLIFDYQRFYRTNTEGGPARELDTEGADIAKHEVWFNAALAPMEKIRDRMEELTQKAKRLQAENGDATDPLDESMREEMMRDIEEDIQEVETRVDVSTDIERAVSDD